MPKVVLSNTLITNNSLSIFHYKKLVQELTSLQKRIYKATVCHDYKNVHQLQRLLFKSKSVKLIIFLKLISSYSNINQLVLKNSITKLKLNTIDYSYVSSYYTIHNLADQQSVVQLLHCLTDQIVISNLRCKLESYLTYLCLKPEWEAKFIVNSSANSYQFSIRHKIKTILQLCSEFNKNLHTKPGKVYIIKNDIDAIQNLNKLSYKYLQSKLNTTPVISKFIQRYLMLSSTKNLRDKQIEHIDIQKVDLFSCSLFYLLKKIIMESLDIEISLYSQLFIDTKHKDTVKTIFPRFIYHNGYFIFFSRNKNEIILIQDQIINFFDNLGIRFTSKNIKILELDQGFVFLGFHIRCNLKPTKKKFLEDIIIQPSTRSQLALLRKVKSILYHKDYLHRIRPNTYLSFRLAIKKVKYLVQRWKDYYRPDVVCTTTYQQLSMAIQIILYRWQVKKYQKKSRIKTLHNLYNRLKINNLLINMND